MPGLGRVAHFDTRNLDYPLRAPLMRGAMTAALGMLGIHRPRSWRQWMYFDQGDMPACTAYSSTTFLAAAPLKPTMEWLRHLDIVQWYHDNREEDRRHGRYYGEGATVLAAMQVGKHRGYWDGYRWTYDLDTMRAVVHDRQPVLVGTNWYPSMWVRDAEGIMKTPGKREQIAGKHMWCVGAYDPKRALYTYRTTWNDKDYRVPEELMDRLIHEDGEVSQPHEVKVA